MSLLKNICFVLLSVITANAVAQTPELVLQKGHDGAINSVRFIKNGKYIMTASDDRIVKVWDPFSNRLISEMRGSQEALNKTYAAPNGKYVVAYSDRFPVFYFWDPLTGKLLHKIDLHADLDNDSGDEQIRFSTSGEFIAIANVEKKTGQSITKIERGINGKIFKTIKDGMSLVGFISDSVILERNEIASKTRDSTAVRYRLHNFITNKIESAFQGSMHAAASYQILSLPKLDMLPENSYELMGNTGRYFLSFAMIHESNYYQLWDIQQKRIISRDTYFIEYPDFIFSPDDKKLILQSKNNAGFGATENVFVDDSEFVDLLDNHNFESYSPKGDLYATAVMIRDSTQEASTGKDYLDRHEIDIWDSSYELKMRLICKKKIKATAFSPDENYFITAYKDGSFTLWNISDSIPVIVSESESVFDPVLQLHQSEKLNKLILATPGTYYSKDIDNINKAVFQEFKNPYAVPDYSDNGLFQKIIFSQDDKYGYRIYKNGLDLFRNDSISSFHLFDKNAGDDSTLSDERYKLENFGIVNKNEANKTIQINSSNIAAIQFEKIQISPEYKETKDVVSKNTIYGFTDSLSFITATMKRTEGSFTDVLSANNPLFIPEYINALPVLNKKDNTYQYFNDEGEGIILLHQSDLSFIKRMKFPELQIGDLRNTFISNNSKYVIGTINSMMKHKFDDIYCVDIATGAIKFKSQYRQFEWNHSSKNGLKNLVFSPDYKTICFNSPGENFIRVIDGENGKPLHYLEGHSSSILGIEYTQDSKYIYSWSADGTCKKWDIASEKWVYTILLFKDHDYAIILPSGYYYISSRTDAKYLNFKVNDRLYNFSQFDLQYNRPDKVLKALGSNDKELMQEYYKAWLKRIEKSHFTEAALKGNSLHVPEVSLEQDNINGNANQKELKLSFTVQDSLYKIDRYNIFINDVPLNGINGKNLGKPNHRAAISQQIILSEGSNKIEVNCSNENGAESRKEVLYINYRPDRPVTPKTYFIGIGIDQYSKNSSFRDLNYCVKDIRDLSLAFKEKYKDDLVTDTLLNAKASKENILALRQKLLHTNVDDRVIISFSGHGMVDPTDHDKFYFVTGKTDIADPSVNGISYDQLEELLDSIPARKKLMLLDACHSGESDKDQIAKGKNIIPGTKRGGDDYNTGNESSVQVIDVNKDQSAHASSTDIFKLMKEAFIDIRRNNGAYVISAAQSNEYAEENKTIGNGVFTHCLLEQLKNNSSLKINELSVNINKCVSESTKGIQNTANRQELAEFNWQLW